MSLKDTSAQKKKPPLRGTNSKPLKSQGSLSRPTIDKPTNKVEKDLTQMNMVGTSAKITKSEVNNSINKSAPSNPVTKSSNIRECSLGNDKSCSPGTFKTSVSSTTPTNISTSSGRGISRGRGGRGRGGGVSGRTSSNFGRGRSTSSTGLDGKTPEGRGGRISATGNGGPKPINRSLNSTTVTSSRPARAGRRRVGIKRNGKTTEKPNGRLEKTLTLNTEF